MKKEYFQPITWFVNLELENKRAVAKIILQEKNPDKYLLEEPKKEELAKFLKNRTAINIIDKLTNLERAILTAENYTAYKIDLDFVQYLKNVTILHLFDAKKYTNLSGLNEMDSLQILHLHNCQNLKAFINIKDFKAKINLFITDCNKVFFTSFINFNNMESLSIMNCNGLTLKTNQNYKYLKEIRIAECTDANIEIDFAHYPYLTTLVIQDTIGNITFKNQQQAKNITFASIQKLGRTPQIQEILANPEPQSFELI